MTERAKVAYDTFRGGFRPGVFVPPHWDGLKDWMRDAITVAHLQGKLDGAAPCKLCNDTGEQRYWEGRWRDEKAENEQLTIALTEAEKYNGWHQQACLEIERLRELAYAPDGKEHRTALFEEAARRALAEAAVEVMRGMLQECRNAIAHLDPMALGGQHANHPEEQEWYFRDELLSRLDSVLIDDSEPR